MRQAGFTLLELLAVLAIMALLLAVIPRLALPVVESVRASGKVQAVTEKLQAAHAQAVASGTQVVVDNRLIFYPDGSSSGGTVEIILAGRTRRLTVNPITSAIDDAP
jgi:prepilin-type N-terminal cleavage/methylation domain-containing protein